MCDEYDTAILRIQSILERLGVRHVDHRNLNDGDDPELLLFGSILERVGVCHFNNHTDNDLWDRTVLEWIELCRHNADVRKRAILVYPFRRLGILQGKREHNFRPARTGMEFPRTALMGENGRRNLAH